MASAPRIFASEKRAAEMLDLPLRDFRRLVERGALPKPVPIGGEFQRWRVRDLEAIDSGKAMDSDFEW